MNEITQPLKITDQAHYDSLQEAGVSQMLDPIEKQVPPVRQSTAQITKAIAAVMREVDVVAKKGHNQFHHYRYAAMQDILQQITPLLGKYGIVIWQNEIERSMFDNDNVVAIKYEFEVAHESGEIWPRRMHQTGVSRCRDSKGGWDDKSLNKCHTAARKYFLLSLFQIPTEEDDADKGGSNSGEKLRSVYASKPIAAEIKAAFLACKSVDQLIALKEQKKPVVLTLNILCQDDIREAFATHVKNLRIDAKYNHAETTETINAETGEVTDQVIWEENGERPATAADFPGKAGEVVAPAWSEEPEANPVRSPLNGDVHQHKPDALEGADAHRQVTDTGDSRERLAPNDPLDIPDRLKRMTPKEEAVWLDLLRSVAAGAITTQDMMNLQVEHMGAAQQRKVSSAGWVEAVRIFRERVQYLLDNPAFDAETWLVGDLAGALSAAETSEQLAKVKDEMLIREKDRLTAEQWKRAVAAYRSRLDEIDPQNGLAGG